MATVLDILQNVYLLYEGDTSYPDFEDDDMQLYFGHLKNSIGEWKKRLPTDDAIAVPTAEGDTVNIPRPMFCVYYILSFLYIDDEANKGLVKFFDDKADDEVRAERVSQIRTARAADTTRPNDQTGSSHGAGFGVLSTNTEE